MEGFESRPRVRLWRFTHHRIATATLHLNKDFLGNHGVDPEAAAAGPVADEDHAGNGIYLPALNVLEPCQSKTDMCYRLVTL